MLYFVFFFLRTIDLRAYLGNLLGVALKKQDIDVHQSTQCMNLYLCGEKKVEEKTLYVKSHSRSRDDTTIDSLDIELITISQTY